MTTTQQLAKHLREIHFGGNWTWSNLKDQLTGVSVQQALKKFETLNTIAALTFHINYYVKAISKVLSGEEINAHDKFSFDHPEFHSEEDWKNFCQECLDDAEKLAGLIEALPDSVLNEVFAAEKYGTYHRNILGLIEHSHYHLGQIALIKKLTSEVYTEPVGGHTEPVEV
jgi:hypothetical protein